MDIKTLTAEEIDTLQVDQALRMMGQNAQILIALNTEIGQALSEMGQAKLRVEMLKEQKRTIIEVQKTLGMIAKHS